MALLLRKKCPGTEFFLVRIWARFTQCFVISYIVQKEDLMKIFFKHNILLRQKFVRVQEQSLGDDV